MSVNCNFAVAFEIMYHVDDWKRRLSAFGEDYAAVNEWDVNEWDVYLIKDRCTVGDLDLFRDFV